MRLTRRLRELIVSIYLYNEWRGYTQLEDELLPRLAEDPRFDRELVEGVRSHAADEKKHHKMFLGWFAERRTSPFVVGPSVGYFDTLVRRLFAGADSGAMVATPESFARLCRAIVTTERRGIRQLDGLLKKGFVREDARLTRVFETIRKDEPSHFAPYERWLELNGHRGPRLRERLADLLVHYTIAVLVVPLLFFNPKLKRVTT